MSLLGNRKPFGLNHLLHRSEPSELAKFKMNPTLYLSHVLYSWRRVVPYEPLTPVTMICISDTHNAQVPVPAGDVLIHAGDLTQSGTMKEL